jgi:hypothetical protein
MLRNPAYAGQAAFGKTQILHESPGLNRRARLAGRGTPRAVKAADRPREEWITIPAPALITLATFERAAQRLADNKCFASRNSRVPSLLQGLSACVSCGYGYYRTSTTTSSGKKIYYYRCLGSDDYRYEGGRVCTNKPSLLRLTLIASQERSDLRKRLFKWLAWSRSGATDLVRRYDGCRCGPGHHAGDTEVVGSGG